MKVIFFAHCKGYSDDNSFAETSVVFGYVQWCALILTVREGSKRAWFGSNQSEARKCQPTYGQMKSGEKSERKPFGGALRRLRSSWDRRH